MLIARAPNRALRRAALICAGAVFAATLTAPVAHADDDAAVSALMGLFNEVRAVSTGNFQTLFVEPALAMPALAGASADDLQWPESWANGAFIDFCDQYAAPELAPEYTHSADHAKAARSMDPTPSWRPRARCVMRFEWTGVSGPDHSPLYDEAGNRVRQAHRGVLTITTPREGYTEAHIFNAGTGRSEVSVFMNPVALGHAGLIYGRMFSPEEAFTFARPDTPVPDLAEAGADWALNGGFETAKGESVRDTARSIARFPVTALDGGQDVVNLVMRWRAYADSSIVPQTPLGIALGSDYILHDWVMVLENANVILDAGEVRPDRKFVNGEVIRRGQLGQIFATATVLVADGEGGGRVYPAAQFDALNRHVAETDFYSFNPEP